MTSRIQRLDPTTISRIAAGEVIERPVSVLKELIDNALDAGSTRLDIRLLNGGRQLIQVTDNGCGMSAEEAMLALQRFTTSKIRHIDDLQTLTTLGFRGEALPSIATVADIEITTRPAAQHEGALVQSQPQSAPQLHAAGCPVGTRVQVRGLFRHVPVRLHALKTVAREVQLMQELVAHYALAYPHVMFHVQHEGRRLLFAQAEADLAQRLAAIVGQDLATQMLPVSWRSLDLVVHGAVSPPGASRATRQRQYVWVNGRPVRSPLVSAALERAYGALLPPGRHPLAALGLRLAPALLDVNIHPRKAEVRFLQERAIFAAVQEAVEMVVQRVPDTAWPEVMTGDEVSSAAWPTSPMPALQVGEDAQGYHRAGLASDLATLQPWGQLGKTFLVASSAQGLVVLDQHAAHESLLYAQLLSGACQRAELPAPWTLALSTRQTQTLTPLYPVLESLGFQLEPFGQAMLLVRAIPCVLQTLLRPATFVEALQEAMQRATSSASLDTWRDHLAAALACRTALRAGDVLSAVQMDELLAAVMQQQLAYTCPHGRPTFVTLSLAELERRFVR